MIFFNQKKYTKTFNVKIRGDFIYHLILYSNFFLMSMY